MATKRVYDPKTGKWKKVSTGGSSSSSKSSSGSKKNNSSGNLTSSNPNKNSGTGSVEKKYNEIELNTLVGTLNFIVTENTIKLKAGDTVKLKGLGKFLTGNYYVKDVTRKIDSNGYSHSATVIKTDFGESLKVKSKTTKKKSTTKKKTTKKKVTKKKVKSTETKKSTKRIYTVKRGDCLWNIAKKYYGSGSKYKKIYDANTDKIANPNLIYPGQKLVIP